MSDKNQFEERWLLAQHQEGKYVANADNIREWVRVRTYTWAELIERLKKEILFTPSTKTLDIGAGPTSVFLTLKEGKRYAVDPLYKNMFDILPFLKDIEQYKDVRFVPVSLEQATFDTQFDVIFTINMLDHVGNLSSCVTKINELLAPSAFLVVVVDCYGDSMSAKIMRFFDIDLPHPHHFMTQDIIDLFECYTLVKKDLKIFQINDSCPFRKEKAEVEIYRIDRFVSRLARDITLWGKKGDFLFIIRYFLSYGLSLGIAWIRGKEKPFHPLKKARLFVFQKNPPQQS
jgi:hypothetical protein